MDSQHVAGLRLPKSLIYGKCRKYTSRTLAERLGLRHDPAPIPATGIEP